MARYDSSMEAMAEMYVFETTSLFEQLDEILLNAEKNNSMSEEDINEIFRIMHTIKGSSAMMGLENMSTLAHAIEDMFFVLRDDKSVKYDIERLNNIVFTANDLLKAELELIEDDTPPTDFSELKGQIKDYIVVLKTGEEPEPSAKSSGTKAPTAAAAPKADEKPISTVKVNFEEDCQMENIRALMLINSIREDCEEISFIPEDIETNPESAKVIVENGFIIKFKAQSESGVVSQIAAGMNVMTYEVLVSVENGGNEVVAEAVPEDKGDGSVTVKVIFEKDCQMENVRAMMVVSSIVDLCESFTFEPQDIEGNSETSAIIIKEGFKINFKAADKDKVIEAIKGGMSVATVEEIAGVAKKEEKQETKKAETAKKDTAKAPAKAPVKQSLISVNLQKLDKLLDMVGELVIAQSAVVSNPDLKGLKLDNFNKASRQLRALTDELQDVVMSTRMLPISGVFNKMSRIVRDMNVKQDKDVELIFVGEDTEVDKNVIDNLNDPLMHMVRNAMDHGIETKEEYAESGKTERSRVTLSAQNGSGEVIIIVADNGKGINDEMILKKANKNGILTKPAEEYTHKEICNLVLAPGFSTNEAVTEFSGRGVGTDVVRKNIENLGGTVNVESTLGEGTRFVMRIPLSLAIVEGMEVAVGGSSLVIPISNIRESFKIDASQIVLDADGGELVNLRGTCHKLVKLHEIYDIETEKTELTDGIAVLCECEDKTVCLFVDMLVGEQQIVVKPFSPVISKFDVKNLGMAGCSILGDGSIVILLDVNTIIEEF